jgi:hypothetical protein
MNGPKAFKLIFLVEFGIELTNECAEKHRLETVMTLESNPIRISLVSEEISSCFGFRRRGVPAQWTATIPQIFFFVFEVFKL